MERTLSHHHPTPPRNPNPPTNVPSNRSAERHEALPKDARTSAETSATDHSRCSEVTMIWKEIRTKRGLRRPSETKQGQRAMISLSDALVCSGNPRAGGRFDSIKPMLVVVHIPTFSIVLAFGLGDVHQSIFIRDLHTHSVCIPMAWDDHEPYIIYHIYIHILSYQIGCISIISMIFPFYPIIYIYYI